MNAIKTIVTLILATAIISISMVIVALPTDYLEQQIEESTANVRCLLNPELIGCGDPYYK